MGLRMALIKLIAIFRDYCTHPVDAGALTSLQMFFRPCNVESLQNCSVDSLRISLKRTFNGLSTGFLPLENCGDIRITGTLVMAAHVFRMVKRTAKCHRQNIGIAAVSVAFYDTYVQYQCTICIRCINCCNSELNCRAISIRTWMDIVSYQFAMRFVLCIIMYGQNCVLDV